ncbi:O-methyltransferase family 2, partial [Penicillium robsamsonii]|uniref:O-methyltransferase family 2 n=1 Tax=Penicillium robsamsonii TaxID=1792511 RepID=UPI0025475972
NFCQYGLHNCSDPGYPPNTDEAGRLDIIQSLKQVTRELQSPKDAIMKLGTPGLTNAMLRIGADMGLFLSLTRSDVSLTTMQIAEITGASAQFLERILRYLAATGIIKETGVNEYTANSITHVLADPKGEAMIYHGPQDQTHLIRVACPAPKGHFENLQKIMTTLQGSEWTEGFDLFINEARKVPFKVSSAAPEIPFFDVGGGHGHQCIELGKKYPNLLGYLVLQDLTEAMKNLTPIDGVKAEAYDFFQTQPITGAKFYYLRRIMHDWPDDKATKILRNVHAAMGPDSRILIDDAVLPDTGAKWQSTVADLAMMIFAGKERTKHQWESLAESVGLRVEHINAYVASTYTDILVLASQLATQGRGLKELRFLGFPGSQIFGCDAEQAFVDLWSAGREALW